MKKMWIVGGGLATLLLMTGLAVASPVSAQASSNIGPLSTDIHAAVNQTGTYEVVNGQAVDKTTVLRQFALLKMNANFHHISTPTTQEMLTAFNRQLVQYQEAVKEDFGVSMQAAVAQSKKDEAAYQSNTADSTGRALLAQYEQGAEITDKQYWSAVAPKGEQMAMSISALKTAHYKEWIKANPNGTLLQWNSVWNHYVDGLLSNATVQLK